MLILWIRKSKMGEQTCTKKNDNDSLQKHNEDMKKFQVSHPKIEITNSQDIKDILTAEGDVLARVQEVKLTKHSQN